jgi:hemolysin III
MKDRPLLKGIFHLFAGISTFSILLFNDFTQYHNTAREVFYKYLYISTLQFFVSSLLHIFEWKKYLRFIRVVDHSIIYIKLVTTYFVYIILVIPDIDIIVVNFLLIGFVIGLISRIIYTDSSSYIIAIPYIVIGWSLFLDFNSVLCLAYRIPKGFAYLMLSGIFYTTGAITYMKRYEFNHVKHLYGYHELFHMLTVIGEIFIFLSINQAARYYTINMS